MQRRNFIRGLAASGFALSHHSSLRAASALAGAGNGRVLVVVFLRGGCDGLNMVVPYADPDYYASRPRISIAPPESGNPHAAIDLDGFFGLHPAMAPLRDSFAEGKLALLPAVHYPGSTRSHFESQSIVERAGVFPDGWLNRYLQSTVGAGGGMAISNQVPLSLTGSARVSAYSDPFDLRLGGDDSVDATLERVLIERYAQRGDPPDTVAGGWKTAAEGLLADRHLRTPGGGLAIAYPESEFARDLVAAAKLIREDPTASIITLSLAGWDTHSNQGGATGRQSLALDKLAKGLAAFTKDLGSRGDDVAVLVQTEFGRTVRENASGGTDHGAASAWMVLGGGIRGGIHLGERGWPGLDRANLIDGRFLDSTLDYRDIYADILESHLGCQRISSVLPDRPGARTGLV